VPEEVVSRVGSFDALGVALLGPIGLLVAGPLTDSFGASSTGVMAAALALAAGVAPRASRGVRGVERRD
ncbi:MAG: hypothetical protein RL487_873, partial [Actinomycetota bacterium]